MPRFFAEITDKKAVIKGDDVAHITGPLRKSVGDEICLRDREKGYRGKIQSITKTTIIAEIESEEILFERGSRKVHLGICLITPKEMDSIMRYVTELGVTDITPVVASRSNIREVSDSRMERWNTIIMEAVKQSGRKIIPAMHDCLTIDAFAKYAVQNWPVRLVAHMDGSADLKDIKSDDTGILIGPEGGFTAQELDLLQKHGFIPVNMGKTTLRAVTAAIAATAMLG
jgi:16S rRNA (uracil1498-N3)-methyltransferase